MNITQKNWGSVAGEGSLGGEIWGGQCLLQNALLRVFPGSKKICEYNSFDKEENTILQENYESLTRKMRDWTCGIYVIYVNRTAAQYSRLVRLSGRL